MREIKFRGFSEECEQWCYGSLDLSYLPDHNQAIIIENNGHSAMGFNVEPNTVGQFTGLKDKNGVEIYEGDICSHRHYATAVVEWNNNFACFCLIEYNEGGRWDVNFSLQDIQSILGNIHDNPELLKGGLDV